MVVRAIACLIGMMGSAAWMSAVESGARKFDVPADLVEKSLRVFSVQSGCEVLFSSDAASGVRTNAINGEFLPGEAVKKMLAGTTLYVRDERDGVFRIAATPRPKAPGAALNPGQNDRPGEAKSGSRSRGPPPGTSSNAQPNPLQASQSRQTESPTVKNRNLISFFAGWLAAGAAADAQTVATQPKDGAVVLSPFSVISERTDGYEATNTNSLIGTQTALKNVPITAEVLNKQFFDDLAINNTVEALRDFTAGVGPPLRGSGLAAGGEGALAGDLYGVNGFTIRGFSAGNQRADGVVTGEILLFDQFAAERTEVIRGPQTLLYGPASPAGVVNIISKQATFGRKSYMGRLRLDDLGSWRSEFDVNQPLGKKTAMRVAAVRGQTKYWRENLTDDTKGLYGQVATRPFSALTLRFQAEHLYQHSINANNSVLLNDRTSADHNAYLHLIIADGRAQNVLNGKLNWRNADSFAGDWKTRDKTADYILASADVRITEWLNARFSYGHTDWDDWNRAIVLTGLMAPTFASNPTGKWAMGGTPAFQQYGSAERSLRSQFVAEFDLLRRQIKNKFNFGAEEKLGVINFSSARYYKLDAAGNAVFNPANRNNNEAGRTEIPVQYYSVENGLNGLPLYGNTIVHNGDTYLLAPRQLKGAVPVTSVNPFGINNNAAGGLNFTESRSRALFAALFSDWFDGRFTTLAGYRYDRFEQKLLHNNGRLETKARTWNAGLVYHATKYLSPYVGFSNNYSPSSQFGTLMDGSPIPDSRGKGAEGGVKFDVPRYNLSGSFTYYSVTSANEALGLSAAQISVVDPTGVNGRFRPNGNTVLRDREVRGYELTATARPTRDWRVRFSLSHIESIGVNGIKLPQVYNDEFNTSADGNVLFDDKTVALVRTDPNDANSALIPLTVGMMKNSSSPYFANLDPSSGRILNLRAGTLNSLGLVGRSDGRTIGTGRAGMPISQHQLGFVSPFPDAVVIQKPGETATGFADYSVSTSAIYTFSSDRFLKGLSLGPTVTAKNMMRAYYYNDAAGNRVLKRYPDQVQVSMMVGYSRKFGRYTWNTQFNVNNAFNTISVSHLPDLGTGRNIDARRDAMPRSYIWTNTVTF
jgi:outer membrane receptor protein involved in Fe transport